ncbi:5-oxoprolinase subunit B family protein [Actinomadura madurae]|uniref:5-oxoprolinase subunit B family protein n=1 Tax=Actinomadura madurae TaxID=1993 RepID=UPI0020D25B34|nr:carboxyltransferase domain-containing protein [Actinomadura madurae]MCP9955670.1 carboxyltransferase domain-containing protein [Actinomadura madurae]MCP9972403.1 carboxyltransferase domain-containing protein [Actinomadura madurae]MCP9984916.1 carboxyltransferase domain-containing protein [Actinomadura madurae]MCQ0003532.1 carboxyltransferase domain-containing protein [Actinomadura madurae]MCQ0021107.1 carboxyltransferase domain-containing protein [Actinomadura madurae]
MDASAIYHPFPDGSRASFGGDEYIFVEIAEAMSLEAALRVQAIVARIAELGMLGILDIAPANTSYMIRLDPDVSHPRDVLAAVSELHGHDDGSDPSVTTQIVEVPVYYDDPWTKDVCLRFRSGHQSPSETDIEFVARINGFGSIRDLVDAHTRAPFIVTFPCFKPGNAESYQLVARDRQIEAPKYLSPRTETPSRAVAHGGAFSVIYPVDGVGGYQLLGRAAVPVVDLYQRSREFTSSRVLTPISTLIQFRSIDRAEYDDIQHRVECDRYAVKRHPVEFSLEKFTAAPCEYARSLKGLVS